MSSDDKFEKMQSLIDELHQIDNKRENIYDEITKITNDTKEYEKSDNYVKHKKEFIECLIKSALIEIEIDKLKKK